MIIWGVTYFFNGFIYYILQIKSKDKENVSGCFFKCRDQTYILDVELEVLGVTEGGLQRLNGEILTSFVGETHQESHNFIGREL